MTGWPDGTERAVRRAGVERLHRGEARARGQQGGVVGRRVGGRVGIEPAAALAARALDHRHQVSVVHPGDLVGGGRAGHAGHDRLAEPSRLDARQHSSEPIGSLGVPTSEVVLEVALVGQEESRHDLATLGRPDTVAPMTGHRLLPGTDSRLRVAPWRGDTHVAHLTPGRGRPTLAAVQRAIDDVTAAGYTSALTGARGPLDQQPFLQAGFEVHERLHLLVRTLDDLPTVRAATMRRGHHADRAPVLGIDAAAFPAFWRLDGPGLEDALAATPSARFRVAIDAGGGRRLVGYAVTGRAGPRGYLQRLAVHPDHQRGGLGGALVVDGLRWLRRWGAKEVLVNTQEGNDPAVRLYEALGFELRPDGLAVLRLALGDASS